MKVVKNTFIDIHYVGTERAQAEMLARRYERRGYSREDDGEDDGEECIQLLSTSNVAIHRRALKGDYDNVTGTRFIREDNSSEAFRKLRSQILSLY